MYTPKIIPMEKPDGRKKEDKKYIITNMKTYTQKQYDSAKERAFKKGFKEGIDCISMEDVLENTKQVNSWKKWEQFDFDWTVTLLVVACVGVILMMIF